MSDFALRCQIIEAAKRLYAKNMLAAADGNISFRISNEHILITPAALPKAFIKPNDIATITLDNRIIAGKPSSERLLHLAIYANCPKAQVVIHAHPPTAIAWTIAKPQLLELPCDCFAEVILGIGGIPIVPYARPGTADLSEALIPFISHHCCLILARHGAIVWAESLEEALSGMERIEHAAEILFKAEILGGITNLPQTEIDYLKAKRELLCEKGKMPLL